MEPPASDVPPPLAGASKPASGEEGGGASGSAEAEERVASRELFATLLKAGNYGTADLVNNREIRIEREQDQPPAQESEIPVSAQLAAQAPAPAQEQAPVQQAVNQQALADMDRSERSVPSAFSDFSGMLAGTGISLAAYGVAQDWQNVAPEQTMHFGTQQFAGQTPPGRDAGLSA